MILDDLFGIPSTGVQPGKLSDIIAKLGQPQKFNTLSRLGIGLLNAGGPSREPTNFLSVLGNALQSTQGQADVYRQQALQNAIAADKMRQGDLLAAAKLQKAMQAKPLFGENLTGNALKVINELESKKQLGQLKPEDEFNLKAAYAIVNKPTMFTDQYGRPQTIPGLNIQPRGVSTQQIAPQGLPRTSVESPVREGAVYVSPDATQKQIQQGVPIEDQIKAGVADPNTVLRRQMQGLQNRAQTSPLYRKNQETGQDAIPLLNTWLDSINQLDDILKKDPTVLGTAGEVQAKVGNTIGGYGAIINKYAPSVRGQLGFDAEKIGDTIAKDTGRAKNLATVVVSKYASALINPKMAERLTNADYKAGEEALTLAQGGPKEIQRGLALTRRQASIARAIVQYEQRNGVRVYGARDGRYPPEVQAEVDLIDARYKQDMANLKSASDVFGNTQAPVQQTAPKSNSNSRYEYWKKQLGQ